MEAHIQQFQFLAGAESDIPLIHKLQLGLAKACGDYKWQVPRIASRKRTGSRAKGRMRQP
jgi:hypothetical protein